MLADGRLIGRLDQYLHVDNYRYWLMEAPGTPREEVAVFRDWLVQQAALTSQELARATGAA
jgi:hypothetical protein